MVERTNGWLGKFQILSKEYERSVGPSRVDVLLAMTSIMLGGLSGRVREREARSAL